MSLGYRQIYFKLTYNLQYGRRLRFWPHDDTYHTIFTIFTGSYSYIDPKYQIRTVEYTADKNGFHPILSHSPAPLPLDTPVVAAAKHRHLAQFARIANVRNPGNVVAVPRDSVAVSRAKDKHFSLYEKIAKEHARIAAEQEAENLAKEGTGRPILEHQSEY